MSDTAKLREALHSPGAFSGSRTPEELRVVYDAAWELLTIKEAGALIITPDEKTVDLIGDAIARSSRQSWDDSARHVLDVLRDAMPPEDAE